MHCTAPAAILCSSPSSSQLCTHSLYSQCERMRAQKTSNLCLFSKSPPQDSTWVKVCVCAKTAKANSLPFTAAGNKPAHPRALTFNDSPADAAEHEEQVLLQHHNGCFLSFFLFLVFFSSRCFLTASLVRLPPCRWQAYPAGCALFLKKGSTRTPQMCRDAPGAERSGGCAVAGLQRDAPRHSDEQSAAPATTAVSATAEH